MLKQHPLSAAFPAMSPEEYLSLVDSVTNNGVINPITTFDGMVLDGWHRYRAACEAGVACPMVELDNIEPQAFVIAQNKNRRHITKGQLALAAAEVLRWRPAGRNPAAAAGLEQKTTKQAANSVGVSERTMRQAKAVEAKAQPVVKKAAKAGKISIERAAEIAQLPPKEQAKAVAAPPPSKPKKVEAEEREYFGPSNEEIEAAESGARADMAALELLVQSDDKLATAVQEVNRLKAELAVVSLSRDGYMNRCNELITRIKTLKRQLELAKEPARV